MVQPLTLLPFWTEKVPLSYIFYSSMVPLLCTWFRTLHPLINALSCSQCRRHMALGAGDGQVNHSEALGS